MKQRFKNLEWQTVIGCIEADLVVASAELGSILEVRISAEALARKTIP